MNRLILFTLLLILGLGSSQTFAQDAKGSKDHSIISRYPNSKILSYYERDYNEIKFANKAAKAEQAPKNFIDVKGKHYSIVYELPVGKTTVEAMKNYKDAIKKKGGQIIFECSSAKCDGTDAWYNAKFFNAIYTSNERAGGGVTHYEHFDAFHQAQKYLVAKITTSDKVYFMEIGMTPKYDDNTVKLCLEIVEQEPVKLGLVKVNADLIKEKMDKNGRIELYGIYFDTGKSVIKESSTAELDEVLKYLKSNSDVNIYIVGHTDDVGNFDANVSLSKARAAAVSKYLAAKGIAASRLKAYGDGPTAPVASNSTESGRKKNRRVELVKRLK